jgi:hypothetical protein
MAATDWNPKKPYDLRERLFEFGCLIIRLVQYLHTRGPVALRLSEQVLKAGTSAPANYEEADDATGSRDKAAKRKIALRVEGGAPAYAHAPAVRFPHRRTRSDHHGE